jgi:hypothetical protein
MAERKEKKYRRVNILITEEQHHQVASGGLSLSGLVRDLLHDRFSDTKITLSLSKRSKRLYDNIISNFGASDKELERFFVEALDRFLDEKSKEISQLRGELQTRSYVEGEDYEVDTESDEEE